MTSPLKSATPPRIQYWAEHDGHPSFASSTKRLFTLLNDATSQVSSWGLMQRSRSKSSMNTV